MAAASTPPQSQADPIAPSAGLSILSFDGGGPGTISQLCMLGEFLSRLATDLGVDKDTLVPADYIDLMGGVGYGAYASLLLGRLRMGLEMVLDELALLGQTLYPQEPIQITSPEANLARLRSIIEDMLKRHMFATDIPLYDKAMDFSRGKVIVFAASTVRMDHCYPFRTYSARRGGQTRCTFVEAACAVLASMPLFAPVSIGPARRQTHYTGIPPAFNNPTQEVLKEAQMQFGTEAARSLVLSLGAGRPAPVSVGISASMSDNTRKLAPTIANDCERVHEELSRLFSGNHAYLRLNVDQGLEGTKTDDWHLLGNIESHTDAYLDRQDVSDRIDFALRSMRRLDTPSTLVQITIPDSKDLFELLKATCDWLDLVLKTARDIANNDDAWLDFINRLKLHLATLDNQMKKLEEDQEPDEKGLLPNLDVIQPLKQYLAGLNGILNWLYHSDPKQLLVLERIADTSCSKDEILQKTHEIDDTFQKYTTALHLFVASRANQMQDSLSHLYREPQQQAWQEYFNRAKHVNAYGVQHKECLQGTRKKTLNNIRSWANSNKKRQWMYCLLDVAGSGKSTVAKTMAEEWKREGRLVARFFFSRDTGETMSTRLFCSTVGDLFANCNPEFERHMNKFKNRPGSTLLSFQEQFTGLITQPLEKLRKHAILTIDALDECDDRSGGRTILLETIGHFVSTATPHLQILVTGRPERDIKVWAENHGGFTNFSQLEGENEDVKLYITQRLQSQSLSIQRRISEVVKRAEGLFIWARVACDLLERAIDPENLLQELEKQQHLDLDYLYATALEQSTPKDRNSHQIVLSVLQMIMATRTPLSIADLEQLVSNRSVIGLAIACLNSILVFKDREDPIRLLHITFRKFITDRARAGTYFVQTQVGHHTLALGCIRHISKLVEQDNFKPYDLYGVNKRKDTALIIEYDSQFMQDLDLCIGILGLS